MKTKKSGLCGAFFAGIAAFTALILTACTFALDPVNAISDAFRFADTNVGILKVINSAENGAVLYGVRVITPDKSLSEYNFETGLLSGNSREYRLPAQITYNVTLSNGKGWTKNLQSVYFSKDETFTVVFTGTEEISVDLSGARGKLTVYNAIPTLPNNKGEYVIENLRVSSMDEANTRENIIFYFYAANGIRSGEKPDFDVLPGDYWIRAQIRNPNGKLSKWSIPAHVGSYSATDKDKFDVSAESARVTVSANLGGIAVFNEKVLEGGKAGGNVIIDAPGFPSIPDNNWLNEEGKEKPNINGKVDPDSAAVKAIKVEKLGFPTADRDGVTVEPKYAYRQKNKAVQDGKIVKTTIYEQAVKAGGEWHLALAEPGWYLLSFSTNGKTFSKAYPVRVSKDDKGSLVVEPDNIPPFNEGDSTWTEKRGVVVNNDTPAQGGPIYDRNGNKTGSLTPADAQKPITDIKVYNLDGSIYGHYRNRYGIPIYSGKEWIVSPALPPGDYLVSLSDDNGAAWTYPPFPFHVDRNRDGSISYDKTHPFWETMIPGKPGPELTSPSAPQWNGTGNVNWRPDIEINPKTPIYVVVPNVGTDELAEKDKPPVQGSQLDIVHLTASKFAEKIYYIKLNSFAIPGRAYRIIDLTRIGGIPKAKRLSLAGFDLKPGLYYVYLSENGHEWWKYKDAVNIPTSWTWKTDANGQNGKVELTREVEKVVHVEEDSDWEPSNKDTDGDGFPNDWETKYGYDPDDSTDPKPGEDDDKDGLTNKEEYGKGTDPKNTDTDGDGYNDKEDADPLNPDIPVPGGKDSGGSGNGGNSGGGGNPNDGGGANLPHKGFVVIQNLGTGAAITSLTIITSGGSVLDYDGTRYSNLPVNIAPNRFDLRHIPVTAVEPAVNAPYKVILGVGAASYEYSVTVWHNRFTYVKFKGTAPAGDEKNPSPGNSSGGAGIPGDGGGGNGGSPPPDNPNDGNDDNISVISGGSGANGPMQPGADPAGGPDLENGFNTAFDRNYPSMGDRMYWSGQVQPYLPYPASASRGGDGTKQYMNNRGYFNFRFFWTADSDWGVGYLAIQKLQRRGTSSAKDPAGPVIVLLDAKAAVSADMTSGEGQRRLGAINGSVKGEDRSFNEWRTNWLGLRNPSTGWQENVQGNGLDPAQPVYRSGKGYYPGRTGPWKDGKKDTADQREYGAHRAYNNPGRLYTTGVTSGGIYAPVGTGFEAGEYRVYLYKGYDSLYRGSTAKDHNDSGRQKKMYRYYEESFDITIYPGVVTTAIYRAALETVDIKGAFAYTPIPQAAFGRLVVLNNPPNNNYTVNAILLDKPGYYNQVNASSSAEVHRYLAALASTPSSMTGGIPNVRNGSKWGTMKPLGKGGMHTFILPPGGYRIAVQSTRDRDNIRNWYGENLNTWLPVVVTEGETVYLTYRGDELSR
jgi:hypothetical protein